MTSTDVPQAPSATTPDAPWGLKKDGTPYKRDPASYRGRKRSPGRRAATAAAPSIDPGVRTQRVQEFLTIPVGLLAGAAQVTHSVPLLADAIVLSRGAPAIAKGISDVALDHERFAEIVDKITASGPYAALFSAMAPVALQLAANHSERVALVGQHLGMTQSVAEIVKSVQPEDSDHGTPDHAGQD